MATTEHGPNAAVTALKILTDLLDDASARLVLQSLEAAGCRIVQPRRLQEREPTVEEVAGFVVVRSGSHGWALCAEFDPNCDGYPFWCEPDGTVLRADPSDEYVPLRELFPEGR